MDLQDKLEKMLKKSEAIINGGIMNKHDMCFECKYFAWGCGTCELDGTDCNGDNLECPNYVDRNVDGEYDD